MILINVEKDENQILKEAVDLRDVVQGKFDEYKTEKFSSLEAAVIRYISGKPQDKRSESIRKVNQGLWVDTGANFIFDIDVYEIARQERDQKKTTDDISQLYHKSSAGGPTGAYATFTPKDAKAEWENDKNSGQNNSINPRTPTSKNETLLDFYRRLSADSKLTFMGKEIEFELPDGVQVTNKSELTVETVVQLFKHVMVGGKDSIYEKAKTKAEAEVAAEKEKEEEPTARVESEVVRYDIKSGKPKTDFIKSFQTEALARFYNNVKDQKLAPIIKGYQQGKFLSDGKYGYRTHHISREAINFLLVEVSRAEKEKRGGLNYKNARSLLRSLKASFDSIHNQNARPKKRTMIRATLIARLDNLLRLLQFKDGKVTNLDKIGGGGKGAAVFPQKKDDKGKKPVEAPPAARKPAPKPREASCWYAQNITFGGEQATSPNTLWARTEGVETFDDWYKKMRTVMNDTRAGDSYTFLTGARTTYRAQVSTMGARRATNINIQCFITIGNALMRVLSALGNTAEMNHSKNPKALEMQAAQFLNNGKYEGSLAYECQVTLYKVVMNAMRNISPKILRAASKLKQGGKNKAASDVASLVGDKAAQKIVSMRGPATAKEGLISEIILIKVGK